MNMKNGIAGRGLLLRGDFEVFGEENRRGWGENVDVFLGSSSLYWMRFFLCCYPNKMFAE